MHQQHSYAIEAVVLKQTNIGEADRIVALFTPYKGKIRAIAKGVRLPLSKKKGHLELLCHSQLQMALGRNLDIVTQAQTSENFPHLRKESWYMICGFYLAELIDRCVEDGIPHQDVYDLLLLALRVLDKDAQDAQQRPAEEEQNNDRSILLLRYFEIHLLGLIGYEPVLRMCANCSAELRPEVNGFTPALGGALCPDCSHLWSTPLSMNALKVLRLLQRNTWAQVPDFHFDARLYREIESVTHGLLRFHLERDLKSWSFLDMLNVH